MCTQDVAAQATKAAEEDAKKLVAKLACVSAASTLINTLTDPPCEFMMNAQNKLVVVSTAQGPKRLKKHTSLIQWSDGTNLTTKPQGPKFLPLELSPCMLVHCKEESGCVTLAKAYKDHWTAYDHIVGFQKFTKGKLPKALLPEDPGKVRYLDVVDPEKVATPLDTLQKVIEAARDSSHLQAAVSI